MKNNLYDVCIVGELGHVGLPLGISLAEAGKKVILFDIDKTAIDTVSHGKIPFMEKDAEEILKQVLGKNLFISSDRHVISESYFVTVVIGTPVDEHLNPKFTRFKNFFSEVIEFTKDDQHIILRSTVFPGNTEKVKEFLRLKGRKTKVSFCPERIAEGRAMEELRNLPQIVSSFDELSFQEAKKLFLSLTNLSMISVLVLIVSWIKEKGWNGKSSSIRRIGTIVFVFILFFSLFVISYLKGVNGMNAHKKIWKMQHLVLKMQKWRQTNV
ncbi:MAG: hypothetical protein OEW45_02215 [Deltaproteobacteria bacterium]|nr:hypothetical protein [Deltaproteobacteria bacterium]